MSLGSEEKYTAREVASAVRDAAQAASAEQLLKALVDFLGGRDADQTAGSTSGNYESVQFDDLSDIQDSNGWIDTSAFIRCSLAHNPNNEAYDCLLEGKFSDGDTGTDDIAESTNDTASNRATVASGQNIEDWNYVRVKVRDNDQDGDEDTDLSIGFK